jgi:hypothetical protein
MARKEEFRTVTSLLFGLQLTGEKVTLGLEMVLATLSGLERIDGLLERVTLAITVTVRKFAK